MSAHSSPKYIFVSGGVLSGLGKGVTAASLGYLLKNRGYSVTNIKCENYLNLDSGNIDPIEHGDVFLCEDGTEADLDLGTYERFLAQEVGAKNYTTIGQIYSKVIQDAQDLKYDGVTVEAIPHIPDEVIRRIEKAAHGFDIVLVELGGTVGEYQNIVYFEAYRILKLKRPSDVIHVHVTYFPKPDHINELKSKPTQLSVKQLQGMGIQPDFIVGRSPVMIDDKRKEKVAYFCNTTQEDVISNPDLPSIYQLPLVFAEQEFDQKALTKLSLPLGKPDLTEWQTMVDKVLAPHKKEVNIAIVAEYLTSGEFGLRDSYASLIEALGHAATQHEVTLQLKFISAESLATPDQDLAEVFRDVAGICLPAGRNERQIEGEIAAIKYAREHKIPYLGLCYGLQLAAMEYARHVGGPTADWTPSPTPATDMRLGGYDCVLLPDSLADRIYAAAHAYQDATPHLISERHRHHFEFDQNYRTQLEEQGLIFSGTSPDHVFVEMIELPQDIHPFFIATQAHPEYKSRPLSPHPLFQAFIGAALTVNQLIEQAS